MKKTIRKTLCILTVISLVILSGCELKISSKKDNNSSSSEKVNSSSEVSSADKTSRGDYYVKGKGDIFPIVERIVKAHKNKDIDSLTDEKDKFIYKCAEKFIKSNIKDSMTPIQKAKEIHDYILINNEYDTQHLNELNEENPDSVTPYGFFKNNTTICLGYTLTFQLLCQMAGVECITIHATANDGEEHGWNMIKLDDKWYHVDVTWDDPIPDEKGRTLYDFFCITDTFMELSGHEWDKSKYPEATSELEDRENLIFG